MASEFAVDGIRFTSGLLGDIFLGMTYVGDGSPDSVANVVALLASEEGFFITGTEVRIDGGTHF